MSVIDNSTYFGKWRFPMTPVRWVLVAISLIAVGLILFRLVTGLGLVTNLNDEWPWGLWISFDVMCGVALAGGGYGTALIVYVFKQEQFSSIARSAALTSLIGYLLVMVGLFLDIGQWWNFWRPLVSQGHSSVLFEVFICVSVYTSVQLIEFGEVATERIGRKYHPFFRKILPVLLVIGIAIPSMHQSSLGALYLLMVDKLHPLWWSPIIFFQFLISSFFVGPAMIAVETALAGRAFNHKVPIPVLSGLVRVSGYAMLVYLVLKFGSIIMEDKVHYLFEGSFESLFFWIEVGFGVIVPLIICFSPLIKRRRWLVTFGVLVALGVILNRYNVVVTGMVTSTGVSYWPSLPELTITLGLVSMGALAYLFICENFRIIEHEDAKH
ncbi:NrfD/PsrC family molybdoenzyme membrane anchor subunit [Proteus faecis]|uniref:Ni/Fe-hydrogenase cytochrome b subunit n=1 Tax=Proteus faecis TaxID=2050967 RepID=A0AAW7CIP7_9GAMM|nr:Ni/Fe-hydrogenase cytochrome b subunit [Proteus faecis]MBG3013282.1 Ni/Fe-hydrogenase cytochrome b subunit [Proteus mirabilis]MCT8248225.1 Ni/Fe-hydrogenase cytochrome b subunit [Proteus faecis]MDL5165628.1 Ni/Fe-hydrogenase cytochrome b subunit [Proteus faecis]MDL5274108.1 Ni/Fe-hydrogenase cytochrome b subunit [Proteus faecis]MDL5277678.1 Ni/Fe-hydrogenase cytochrome b subunit [Proteus faecis]